MAGSVLFPRESGCCKLSKLPATAATVAMNYNKKALIALDVISKLMLHWKAHF
jgi:hypothetical protein